MSAYVYWWIAFTDAGQRVECQLCGTGEDIASPPGIATVETEAFVRGHRSCGGDAA